MRRLALLLILVVLTASTGCIKKLALGGLANTLAAGGDSFGSDDDPELVRDALPFALKTMESILQELPEHLSHSRKEIRGLVYYFGTGLWL